MSELLNKDKIMETNVSKVMITELRRLDVREINDTVNRIVGSRGAEQVRQCPQNETVTYKDRLYLAKRRGDPLMLRVIVDGNCCYCKRLVNLRWAACPYCANGKKLPVKKEL